MNFSGDQIIKTGPPPITTQNVPSTSAVPSASLVSSGILSAPTTLPTLPTAFTLPTPATTSTSAPLQLKPIQTSVPSIAPALNSTPTSLTTGFPLGGGILNQLKGQMASNPPSSNLTGGLSNDKKLGTGSTTLPSGTSQNLTQQLTTASTTHEWNKATTTQSSIGTSLLPVQPGGDKQASQMTYAELETTVNKLIGKLTDNEEEFAKLAREMNDWDKSINENHEKLLLLTETVKTVKCAQIKLNYDLDFIAIEHKDFESIVATCEKEVENYNFTQPSRHDVYQKAVNVDIQIRRMCEELREVIEHLNDRLRFCESDDPVMQIGRVLNAHMESLKWVDESTTQIYDYITYLSQIQEQMKKNLPQVGN